MIVVMPLGLLLVYSWSMARSSCGVVYVTASPPSGKAVAVVAVVVHMHNESMVILFVFLI